MSNRHRVWSKKQEQILIENHGKIHNSEIAKLTDKTIGQVESKVTNLRDRGLLERPLKKELLPKISKYVGRGVSLKDKSVEFEVGEKYHIVVDQNNERKTKETFTGILIQQTPRHITLEGKSYITSFMKVDFLTRVHLIKKIS